MKATRDSYGEALAMLGEKYADLVVLDADLSNATKTIKFQEKFPERFFDVGIAEQDLMGTAAGLALGGKIPFASTFAIFASGRAYDQVRNSIAYSDLNVKIAATHAGITVGEDGASHQALEDIALMRAIPNMVVLCPSDDRETKYLVEEAIKYQGPMYLRLARPKTWEIYDENETFEIGKSKKHGNGKDVTMIATGVTVQEALKAQERRKEDGVEATVIDMYSLKPLDEEAILEAAKNSKLIVTVEDHSIIGGLGSAVCEVLSEKSPKKVIRIGIPDTFGLSGKYEQLMEYYGIDAKSIAERVITELKKK